MKNLGARLMTKMNRLEVLEAGQGTYRAKT